VKPAETPLIPIGFVTAFVAVAIWLIMDTVRAIKAGQARFEWFTDNRTKNSAGFWFNIAFRFLLAFFLLAASAILTFDLRSN
jgi:hypothetical protein